MSLLEQHFDVAFAAPDGIKKLRELILTLAMQGKLVPQDPNDEPASELLRSIEADQEWLVKEGKIKKSQKLPIVTKEEQPFKLPKSWIWARSEYTAQFIDPQPSHRTPPEYEGGIPYIGYSDIDHIKGINFANARKVSPEVFEEHRQRYQLKLGDFVFGKIGTLGQPFFLSEPFEYCLSANLILIQPNSSIIHPKYLAAFLDSPSFLNFLDGNKTNSTHGVFGIKKARLICLPLPPLAEQRRIVAKIDQLMARCDELEKLRIDRSQRLLTVHTAALDQLLTAEDSSEFSTAWSFITQHFGELYSVKENVVELRKTILQLAVMGKLVPQDPNDEPASELLRSIELEKQRLVKEGKIKKSKPLPEIDRQEIPYDLPKEWVWARLGDISLFSDSGWSPQCLSEPRSGQEWGVLKVSAVSWGEFRYEENKALPPGIEAKPECEVRVGDFLISRANTEELVARSVLVKSSPICLMMSDKIVRFKLSQKIEKEFINFVNLSQFSREYYASNASGTSSSMKNISREVMNNLPIPFPPLAEQRRIVEKIDRLMGMCDRLEESISSGKGKQTDLLNALMSQV